jgi:pimeloyl-ACP methyl ester carboxylesterase
MWAFVGKGWGDSSATINILAVHGIMDNAASFDRLAPLLVSSNENIRIVALDFSGHGKSDHRPDFSSYFTSWITEGYYNIQTGPCDHLLKFSVLSGYCC